MTRIGLQGKFFVTLTIGTASLIFMAVFFLFAVNNVDTQNRAILQTDVTGQVTALEIARDINYVSRLTRDSMLGGNTSKNLERLRDIASKNETQFSKLLALPFTQEELTVIQNARTAASQFVGSGDRILQQLESTPEAERHLIYKQYEKDATPLANAFRKEFDALAKLMHQRYTGIQENMSQRIAMHRKNILFALFGFTLLIYGAGYLITRNDLQYMKECVVFASQLGNTGLTHRIDSANAASMEPLAQSLNAAAENIHNSRQQVEEAMHHATRESEEAKRFLAQAEEARKQAESAKREGMQTAAMQLKNIVGSIGIVVTQLVQLLSQSEEGSRLQSARVAETATAMEEMNSSVLEVARNAATASDVSSHSKEKALHGAQTVKTVSVLMEQLQGQSVMLRQDMETMTEHSKSITEIMSVISDIADQTNLLALNAAIEAARAGEAGRGFAVVADEVRKLAEKTMHSTTDVGQVVQAIQQSTNNSKQQVEQTASIIGDVSASVNNSGDALTEIVHLAESSADQARAIATASKQQSAASEEINHAITDISATTANTAEAMHTAHGCVEELASQIQELQKLITELQQV
ncbi:methyl-accepting chemotaxis protein [Desulfovibrio cuneatus]|uniref:methyl-accepting chemotaxis protein n=1 Tax=Desulfovibrio cuneatus TaxID=159728 RepID=UPI00040B1AFB|nr:methyl-accepting chemotaxis protein [Desulfovibrio cuneatus]